MIVSNSGPLIALARIGRLDLLPALFREVAVPPAVHREVTVEGMTGASDLATAAWLRIEGVDPSQDATVLEQWVDHAEAEAIRLAARTRRILLIDERRGRDLAALHGVEVIGTLGMLLVAKEQRLLSEIEPVLRALVAAGIHLGESLIREAISRAGEGPAAPSSGR